MEPSRGPLRAGVSIWKVPILALSGQFAGPSEPKLASASVQLLWPSAASGLIVRPGGQGDGRRFDLRGGCGLALELGVAELDVKARGGVGSSLVGSRRGPV